MMETNKNNMDLRGNNNSVSTKKYKDVKLDGYNLVLIKRTETERISLNEVSPEEIKKMRSEGIPTFVLCDHGKYFAAKIPKDIPMVGRKLLMKHVCAQTGEDCCIHLSCLPDEAGGCQKVRDIRKEIESYPWLVSAYETFNTKYDCFSVGNCSKYEKCSPRKHRSMTDVHKIKLAFAQNYFPDAENMADVKIEMNKIKKFPGE